MPHGQCACLDVLSHEMNATTEKRKKRKAEAPEVAVPSDSVLEADAVVSVPRLTDSELMQLKLYRSEARAAKIEADLHRVRKKYILALIDTKNLVEAEEKLVELRGEDEKHWTEKYQSVLADAAARLGVDLTGAGVDLDTGAIMLSPDSAKGQEKP